MSLEPKEPTAARIRVLAADDHPIIIEGLRRYLASIEDLELVGSASTAAEATAALASNGVDVLVCDVQMPGMGDGLGPLRAFLATGAAVVLFTLRPGDAMIASLLAAGARGFVSKTEPLDVLVDAVRAVHAGRDWIPPELAPERGAHRAPPHAALSEREYAVFVLLARCLTPKEVAFELGVAPSTVYTHADRIRAKLGVATLAEIAQYAREWNLFE